MRFTSLQHKSIDLRSVMYRVNLLSDIVKSCLFFILLYGFSGVMLQGKKKKQPKNAFYFFMVHFRSLEEAKGVKFHDGWKDVADKAGPVWKVRQD